ncbi:hypothetical protein B0H10DRAFT_2054472 [Mycena sp. CBHHK59/15]|nr:hypothetical protein B0H10DRAFT_2054472 [Mycena sp. CBHHK59/15]
MRPTASIIVLICKLTSLNLSCSHPGTFSVSWNNIDLHCKINACRAWVDKKDPSYEQRSKIARQMRFVGLVKLAGLIRICFPRAKSI